MFPTAGITDETEILVSSPDYLTAVSGIVSNSDRSALNNYMIWCLVKEYLPYLSTEYTAEYQQYVSELTGKYQLINLSAETYYSDNMISVTTGGK